MDIEQLRMQGLKWSCGKKTRRRMRVVFAGGKVDGLMLAEGKRPSPPCPSPLVFLDGPLLGMRLPSGAPASFSPW